MQGKGGNVLPFAFKKNNAGTLQREEVQREIIITNYNGQIQTPAVLKWYFFIHKMLFFYSNIEKTKEENKQML